MKDVYNDLYTFIKTVHPNCGVSPEMIGCVKKKSCLAPMPSAVPAVPFTQQYYITEEQGNNPMNYASASISTPATETQDQRKYLTNRLQEVYNEKRDSLEATFGLIDDEPPTTAKEMLERIEAGKFVIKGLDKPDRWFEWYSAIQWRDPAKKADKDGFEAARKALKAERQKVLDIIKIDEPKAGLEAIKALEAWTPAGAAN